MMIECMAGKSAAVHGLVHDATPFKFSEDDPAIDYFGKLLQAGNMNCLTYFYEMCVLICILTAERQNVTSQTSSDLFLDNYIEKWNV